MLEWHEFAKVSEEIAAVGTALLARNEVAFLATVSATGRPRIHPFVPRVVAGHLLAFIMDSSPKYRDLLQRRQYAIHALPGVEDEEFFISGEATSIDTNLPLREAAIEAMGFATGVDAHHKLFDFRIDRALATRWLDFGTPQHRPEHVRWTCK